MADIIQKQDSRRVFIETILELMDKDSDIIIVTCDVGFNYLNKVQEKYPDRYFNFGVTEQSTVMICVGLALSGKKPWFYSMINFVLFRPAEMVRNGVVKHNANVKIIGVKGSEKYKFLGFSHNLLHDKEDTNFCDNIGLKHYTPQSNEEVRKVILETYKSSKPSYVRL